MSTSAQQTANAINAQSSTGPTSEAGRATSSKNAIKYGLFTTADFILPGEQPIYDELITSLEREHAPVGILENTLVAEIRRATWRLRRCSLAEEALANFAGEPLLCDDFEKLQRSADRGRSLSLRTLHKCNAELRKLQTERLSREEHLETPTAAPVLADTARIRKTIADRQKLASFCKTPAQPESASFCKTPETAPPLQQAA